MATRKIPMFTIIDEHTNATESILAASLVGKRYGYSYIYNTNLKESRLWDGNNFISYYPTGKQLSGTLTFNNEKIKSVIFSSQFLSIPSITFSNNSHSSNVNFKTNISINGFTMNFQTKYDGSVDWIAQEKM